MSNERKCININWDAVTAISSVAIALIALVAAIFAWRQIEDSRRAAKIQRLVEEAKEFDTRFLSIRKNFVDKRLASNLAPVDESNPPVEIYAILNYFEYLGALQKRGAIDKEDVREVFGYWIDNFYPDSKPVIAHEQKKSPATYENFVALVKIVQEHHVIQLESAKVFYDYEKRNISGLSGSK